ncbi:MAG TPA: hypothetical protein VFD00_04560 [Thermoclostridium sp.]|nr:hypothetical protein [Thermoclostridium sp.]
MGTELLAGVAVMGTGLLTQELTRSCHGQLSWGSCHGEAVMGTGLLAHLPLISKIYKAEALDTLNVLAEIICITYYKVF